MQLMDSAKTKVTRCASCVVWLSVQLLGVCWSCVVCSSCVPWGEMCGRSRSREHKFLPCFEKPRQPEKPVGEAIKHDQHTGRAGAAFNTFSNIVLGTCPTTFLAPVERSSARKPGE